MNDNRDELLRQLRKEASETPLTGWTSKSGQPPPRFKSPPDDEYIDRLIVKGHPLDEMGAGFAGLPRDALPNVSAIGRRGRSTSGTR